MDESIFPRVAATTRSKRAWEILETTYQGITKVKVAKLQSLRRSFENLQMNESESIYQFMNKVMNIVNQIRANGEYLIEQKIIEKIMRSLPSKFDAIVVAIEESKDLTQLSVDELIGYLLT